MDSKTPFHLSGSEVISGTEDKRPNIITKHFPIALITYPKSFGICEARTVDEDPIYMKNIFWLSE